MQKSNPTFLQSFFGSFFGFSNYPEYVKRSLGSFFGQFFLLITLCSSLFALMTSIWLQNNVSPDLRKIAARTPTIEVVDGRARVEIEQPFVMEEDGHTFAVIDTTTPPMEYLEKYPDQILIVGEKEVVSRDVRGQIKIVEYSRLSSNFSLNAEVATGWVDTLESWFLPVGFLFCLLWHASAKMAQVLLVAGIVTLYQSSRPNFSTHLKLAILALGPALAFAVMNYAISVFYAGIPAASLVYWMILLGITLTMSEKMKKTPEYS